MLVSVIIPTFNTPADWLKKAINSVLIQEGIDLELIVVDDSSEIPFSGVQNDIHDDRIRYIRSKTNLGVSASRNIGINEAKGKWVSFLDADDWWAPGKLSTQLEQLTKTNTLWCYTSAYVTSNDEKVISLHEATHSGRILKQALSKQIITGSCSGVIIDRTLLNKIGGFDESGSIVEDWDMWIRIAEVADVCFVPQPLVYLRWYTSGRRSQTVAKLSRLHSLQQKHRDKIIANGLESKVQSHYFSVKAKLLFISRNYFRALVSAILSIYYLKDPSMLNRAMIWLRNHRKNK